MPSSRITLHINGRMDGNMKLIYIAKKLTIQNQSNWHNLFLLEYNRYTLTLSGPNGFKIEIDARDKDIRVDIECRELLDIDIYYYVDAKYWQAQVEFIVDICQQVYDSYTTIKNQLSTISNKTYGIKNPPFLLEYYRNRQIEKII